MWAIKLLQQNPPVLNWGCWLTQVFLYNDRNMVTVVLVVCSETTTTRMWAIAQPDGRPAEHRWRPLFNAAKFG